MHNMQLLPHHWTASGTCGSWMLHSCVSSSAGPHNASDLFRSQSKKAQSSNLQVSCSRRLSRHDTALQDYRQLQYSAGQFSPGSFFISHEWLVLRVRSNTAGQSGASCGLERRRTIWSKASPTKVLLSVLSERLTLREEVLKSIWSHTALTTPLQSIVLLLRRLARLITLLHGSTDGEMILHLQQVSRSLVLTY